MGSSGELTSRAVSSGNTTKKLETNLFVRKLSENQALRRAFAQQGAMFKLSKVSDDLPDGSTKDYGLG